jgi:hypothetical protein
MNGTSMLGMPMPGMHGARMSGLTMALPLFVVMMASAIPTIVRRARDGRDVLAAPLFAGSYLGDWALVGLAIWLLYQPPRGAASGRCSSARASTSSRR